MDLETLLQLIRDYWPERYERGRILHVHKNDIRLPDGTTRHLRLMLQTTLEGGTDERKD